MHNKSSNPNKSLDNLVKPTTKSQDILLSTIQSLKLPPQIFEKPPPNVIGVLTPPIQLLQSPTEKTKENQPQLTPSKNESIELISDSDDQYCSEELQAKQTNGTEVAVQSILDNIKQSPVYDTTDIEEKEVGDEEENVVESTENTDTEQPNNKENIVQLDENVENMEIDEDLVTISNVDPKPMEIVKEKDIKVAEKIENNNFLVELKENGKTVEVVLNATSELDRNKGKGDAEVSKEKNDQATVIAIPDVPKSVALDENVNQTSRLSETSAPTNESPKDSSCHKDNDIKLNKNKEQNAEENPMECNKKRRAVSSDTDDGPPSKRLCQELEQNFGNHNKLLNDFIEKSSTNNIDEIQRNVDLLLMDIQNLNDLSRAKELEWNNILHLKKVKEEIVLRLTRKKEIMEIMSTRVGEVADYSIMDTAQQPSLSKNITKELLLTNASMNSNSITMVPLITSTPGTPTASIASNSSNGNTLVNSLLQNRANMKPADLAKEKATTARLHRYVWDG